MRAVTVDRSTLYCVGSSTDPEVVAEALRGHRVRVEPVAPGTALRGSMVALAAHDLSGAQLRHIATSTRGSWVHLVSSAPDYPHVPALARHNVVTRSARAYAPSLAEYVVTQHVLRTATATAVPKPFHRRAAVVLGYGAVGRTVADVLARLGARVTVVRPRSRVAIRLGAADSVPLDELPDRFADLMVVALPGVSALSDFAGDTLLRCLALDGHLINPARSAPVERAALLRWLAAGTGHLTTDVDDGDQARALAPWVACGRITRTPHIAWRPWDGDPLYHRDWATIYAAAATGTPCEQWLRVDPRVIDPDFLVAPPPTPQEPRCPSGC
ncbi:NAD(P)-dependent oxidoreductase [Nocardia harenae]|uniref:NAD(P)-dependent oxidoreductase n=1 Tax=Nocardia harenae TaxID=358707 RepID=UPI00083793D2|nr:NAD(P)-dependent oxidoreductase [Nocardia harenae]